MTDDFQPAVFSNADLKLAKKELKQALHHKQAKALEHQDLRVAFGVFGGAGLSRILGKEIVDTGLKHGICGSCCKQAVQDGHELLKCSRCKNQWYCSKYCQKQHWEMHKTVCVRFEQREIK